MDKNFLSKNYHGLPFKVYLWGSIMVLFAIVNLFYLLFEPEINPFIVLFFYSIPANTAISFFPHEPVIIYYGKYHSLLLIAIISSLSTLTAGFLDHVVFTPLLNLPKFSGYKNNTVYKKAIVYFEKFPFWTIVVAGFSPIPFWPIKMLSFSKKYPLGKYLTAVLVGRFPRYYLLAAIGEITSVPNWVIWSLFIIFIGAAVYDWLKTKNGIKKQQVNIS